MFLNKFSRVLYSLSNLIAVFLPTPGIPGMLSDVSPVNDLKSII